MPPSKTIAVIGATGVQGQGIINAFLATPTWAVRAITRDPTSEKAKSLASKGAEVVKADLTDKESLLKAFKDVHAVFLNTDFWNVYYSTKTALEKEGKDVVLASDKAFAAETTNDKNVAEAAASTPTLERFIYSALSPIAKATHGKYSRSLHSEAKAWIVECIEREQPELAKKTSFIYVGVYDNNRMLSPRKDPSSGKFSLTVPLKKETMVPLIDANVSVGKYTLHLVENEPAGIKLLAYDSYMTIEEVLKEWEKASGQECTFTYNTTQSMHDRLKLPWELLDAADYLVECGLTAGFHGVIGPAQLSKPVQTQSFQEWLAERNWPEV